jgi:hypothetical protein
VILLSAWLGAAIFFAAVVAQAAFRVLPTRSLAGALVGRTLPALFIAGLVIGLVAAVLTWREPPGTWGRSGRFIAELIAVLACAVGQFVIGGRIERLRASLGGALDALPPGDPARAAFGRLHGLSVLALGVAMLLVLAAIIVAHRSYALSSIVRD